MPADARASVTRVNGARIGIVATASAWLEPRVGVDSPVVCIESEQLLATDEHAKKNDETKEQRSAEREST
jgi:hypothetical protein